MVCIKFAEHNIRITHRPSCHFCICWLTNSIPYVICAHVYDLFLYHMSYVLCHSFISYHHEPKAKEDLCAAAIFLIYSLLKYYLNKNWVLPYIILGLNVWTIVASTSQAGASTMLLFLIVWNEELWLWGILQWYNVHTKFCENSEVV